MNKKTMLEMLELSSCAYRDNQPVCSFTKLYVIEDKNTDTECFVRIQNNGITISFRGTDSETNRLLNLCIAKKEIPYGNKDSSVKIHCGFLKSYKSVRDKILELIPHQSCRITITGHSLGAALAVLCAVDIQYNFASKDVEVYIFGCPRIGNSAFAKSYNRRVFKTLRVSNGNDIVTKIPPAIAGYRHVGIPIHIGRLQIPFAVSLNEHRPESYYKSLWKTL